MSRGDRLIEGMIYYSPSHPELGPFARVACRLREWQELIDKVFDADGFRRAEGGETFLHGSDGRLVAEAWAIVQTRRGSQS